MMMSQLLGFLERRITKQNLEKTVVFFCNTFYDERKFVSFCCITAFGSGISVSLDKKRQLEGTFLFVSRRFIGIVSAFLRFSASFCALKLCLSGNHVRISIDVNEASFSF